MTSVGNIVPTIPQNVRNINFKAGENDRYSQYQAPVITQPPMLDQQDQLMLRAMQEQKKKEKKRNLKQNIGLGAQVALAGAFVTMAICSVIGLKRGAAGGKKEVKTLFSKVGDMPKLTDDCVNPDMKNFINRVTKLFEKSPEIRQHLGLKDRANMVLFHGPTGTGKTFSAKLLAKEMGAEYGEVQFADLSSPYVGETAVLISKKFAELAKIAKENPDKKFVVAFNEIDSLINNINKLGSNNLHLGQNRTSFLNGLDSIRNFKNLTIVGTTNVNPHSANLDPATLSRLGEIFEIKHPSVKELKAAIKYHLGGSNAAKDLIKNDAELEKLAQSLHSKQGVQRDVESIVNTALENVGAMDSTTTSTMIEAKHIQDVINSKNTWAAAIDSASGNQQEIAQYLEQPGVLDYLKQLLGISNKKSA